MNFEEEIKAAQLQAQQEKEQERINKEKQDIEDFNKFVESIVDGIREAIINAAKKVLDNTLPFSYNGVYDIVGVVGGGLVDKFLVERTYVERTMRLAISEKESKIIGIVRERLLQDEITIDDHFIFKYIGSDSAYYSDRKPVRLNGTLFVSPVTVAGKYYDRSGHPGAKGYIKDGSNQRYTLTYGTDWDCYEDFHVVIRCAYHDKLPEMPKHEEPNGGGCYIATAVYGSYDCPPVWTLRRYRDYSLSKSFFGRIFIRFYYAVSPKVVRIFGTQKWFNHFWKKRLDKFVSRLRNAGYEDFPYTDCYF